MIHFPVLRWGSAYESLEVDTVFHFATGEPVAKVSQTNPGLVARDMRKAARARELLREVPTAELLGMVKKAAELFSSAELPLGNGTQTAAEFVRQQSATTGLPEKMCRMNMEKLRYVLDHIDEILLSLTRGLDPTYSRGVMARSVVSCVATSRPRRSWGWCFPRIPPASTACGCRSSRYRSGWCSSLARREPWTPWRMAQAFFAAGVPREAISVYPGLAEVGAAVLGHCPRSLIFGGTATVERYAGNPNVQVHGPGFSKIRLGDDVVDDWEEYLDLMVDSVLVNSGRGCINCSGIWAARHTGEIAAALAERLGAVRPLPPEDPEAMLAAFTVPGQARAISADIDKIVEESGVEEVTATFHPGGRLIEQEHCDYLCPTVLHCQSPDAAAARKEYMFPFVTVVQCPEERILASIGPTLVATAITKDAALQRAFVDARHIDRLNWGRCRRLSSTGCSRTRATS